MQLNRSCLTNLIRKLQLALNTSSLCTSSALLTLQSMPFCVITYREILQWLWTNWHHVSRITNWNSNLTFLRHIAGQATCIKETMLNLRLKLFHWRFSLLIQFATCLFQCKCHSFWTIEGQLCFSFRVEAFILYRLPWGMGNRDESCSVIYGDAALVALLLTWATGVANSSHTRIPKSGPYCLFFYIYSQARWWSGKRKGLEEELRFNLPWWPGMIGKCHSKRFLYTHCTSTQYNHDKWNDR